MPSAYYHYRMQLKDGSLSNFGSAIISNGGTCYVAKAGLPDKETLYDKNGNALTNPLQLTGGQIEFYTTNTDASVDLYIMAPGGQFKVMKGVSPSGPNEISVDTSQRRQTAVIPFNIGDTTAATETDTGFALPATSMVLDRLHGLGVNVIANESGKTINFGTLSTNSGGSANGFINGTSVASKGQVLGTNGGGFSTNAPYLSDANPAALELSYTLSSGSAAAKGFIVMPYVNNS